MGVPSWVYSRGLPDEVRLAMIEEEIRIEKLMWKCFGWTAFSALIIMITIGVI